MSPSLGFFRGRPKTNKVNLNMKTRNPKLGALYALTGAFLFGLNASTSKVIISSGITAEQVVLYRSAATALLAGLVLIFTFRAGFRVRLRELPLLVAFGIVGVGLMQWAYSQAVAGLQVGIALLIEYTATWRACGSRRHFWRNGET
jgi:drug/metabolite transporter (DMT)-like permease